MATLAYFTPPSDGSPPYTHVNADATGAPVRNWLTAEHTVAITDVRGREHAFALDTAGFQFGTAHPTHTAFDDDDVIAREYYPPSIALIKHATSAADVIIFDHTIRRRRPGQSDDSPDKRQPVTQVHVDQTPSSAIARVHRHAPPHTAPRLLQRRFQIINLWRPIHHPATDFPLALCDYRSVAPNDVTPVTLIYPDRTGETLAVTHNPDHNWVYLSSMTPDEYVLIKCFDSDTSVATFTPHTAFIDPSTPPDAPLRESIELRALVFY